MKNLNMKKIIFVVVLIVLGFWGYKFLFFSVVEPQYVQGPLEEVRLTKKCQDLYVSVDGDDTSLGLSSENPLATLTKALQVIVPGCSINLLPGVYDGFINIDSFNNFSKIITIKALDVNNRPVFDGENKRQTGIIISNSKNIVLSNLIFRNYSNEGVYIFESEDIVVEDSEFYQNGFASTNPDSEGEGFGINVDTVKRVTLQRLNAHNNGPNEERQKKGMVGMGINTYEMKDSLIIDSIASDNMGGGILVEDSESVKVLRNIVERNQVDITYDGWWDAGIWIDGGKNIEARGNILRGNLGPGIQMSDEDNNSPTGYIAIDNIFENNYFGLMFWNLNNCPYPNASVGQFEPNVFKNNSRKDVFCSPKDYEV